MRNPERDGGRIYIIGAGFAGRAIAREIKVKAVFGTVVAFLDDDAAKIGDKVDDPIAMYLNDIATIPVNLAGNAAMSLPIGLAPEDGLPVGLQIMAPALADDRLYNVGAALEAALLDRWGHPILEEAPSL